MVAERRLRAAALAGAAAAQRAQTSNMTEQDGTVPALTAQVHQFTQWVGELQQRLAAQLQPQQQQPQQRQQQQQQQRFLQGKELRIARFGGNRCHNLSDEIIAVFGTRQANIAIALGWAERRDNATPKTIDQGRRQRSLACEHLGTSGEPRSIVKGCWGNGIEAWRKLRADSIQKRR